MAKNKNIQRADLDSGERTARGTRGSLPDLDDAVTENQIDRLEAITGGDNEDELQPISGDLQSQFNSLDASTEEELDALEVNLAQDGGPGDSRDGSGRVADDIAEEEIAKSTEVGPAADDRGAESVEPGRQDTSEALRRHRPVSQDGNDSDAIVEGNIDQPLDEGLQ
jgi:hypothetical protein